MKAVACDRRCVLDECLKPSVVFITGTDTGVGKTILTALLAGHLRRAGVPVAALKPICSGNRGDARRLRAAAGKELSLDDVNPWHFREALAPALAARREGRSVRLAEVLDHVSGIRRRFKTLLVEGAGGLLSPLGADFDSRDLLLALGAVPIVVCPNRLGALNQSLLVLAALPRRFACRAQLVLVSPAHPDGASRSNRQLLAERIGPERVHLLPRLKDPGNVHRALERTPMRRAIATLVASMHG